MRALLGRVLDDHVGLGDLAQRIAAMAFLAAAPLARARAQAAQYARLLLQPVARRRLGAVGAVQAQPSPKLGHLSAKTLDLACLSRYKGFDFGRTTHPTLGVSEIRVLVPKNRSAAIDRAQVWLFGLTPPWQLQRAR